MLKDLDKFVFAETPVDEGQVRELATGGFLDAKRNAIFIGGTGTGKTHLCIGVASAGIRARAEPISFRSGRPVDCHNSNLASFYVAVAPSILCAQIQSDGRQDLHCRGRYKKAMAKIGDANRS